MEKEILAAWSDIEKLLICLTFDGSPESIHTPWTAESDLEGFYGLQGGGKTPLAAVQNFVHQVQELRKYNDQNHGVNIQ